MKEEYPSHLMSKVQEASRGGRAVFEPPSGRTPLYATQNSARYQRQDLIRSIQDKTGSRLICYVSGDRSLITHDDAIPFRDLLHAVGDGENIELLLHTLGGNIDAAERLIFMIRDKVGDATFRIVVPHLAKSAGTLMVLGADSVVMSDTSELGPIDPQVSVIVSGGERMWLPAQSYLDAFEEHTRALERNPNDLSARIMIEKLDPTLRQVFISLKRRAQRLAENLLTQGMFYSSPGNWTLAATELLDTRRWQTHSQGISWRDAKDARLGLNVDYLAPHRGRWQRYWQLYCLQRLAIESNEKLFESDFVSLRISQ